MNNVKEIARYIRLDTDLPPTEGVCKAYVETKISEVHRNHMLQYIQEQIDFLWAKEFDESTCEIVILLNFADFQYCKNMYAYLNYSGEACGRTLMGYDVCLSQTVKHPTVAVVPTAFKNNIRLGT